MPLIILGLIVILGACLLIYYQLGPKVTLRLKSGFGGFGGFGSGQQQPAGADGATAGADGAGGEAGAGAQAGEAGGPGAGTGRAEGTVKDADDEKVLYVFGDGELEERSLHEDDKQGDEQ